MANAILDCSDHLLQKEFELLPSGRFRVGARRTWRHTVSFVPGCVLGGLGDIRSHLLLWLSIGLTGNSPYMLMAFPACIFIC